jgi:hypothetical protein
MTRRSPPSSGEGSPSDQVVFGKRANPPRREVSFGRERLWIIGAELNLLFAYRVEAAEPFASLSDENGGVVLVVGRTIGLCVVVEIEEETGLLVLFEHGAGDVVLMTSSEMRVIDHIVALCSGASAERMPRTANSAVDALVGRSIAEVEERLVTRTLLKFQGDHRQAAFALGIDEAALRARLRRYFLSKSRVSSAIEGQS